MYLNKALILGNLTRDPEMRALPSGVAVATFSIATNRVFKDRDGNKQEAAEFHNVVVFGRQAEICSQYLRKGRSALIEGRLQTRSWDDAPTGQKKYRTEIVAERVQFGPQGPGTTSTPPGPRAAASSAAPASQEGGQDIDYPEEDINPDDIPF